MKDEDREKIKISNDFWNMSRSKLTNKETFKDVTIIKWNKDKENIIYSVEEKRA